jgi:hypothetical protein
MSNGFDFVIQEVDIQTKVGDAPRRVLWLQVRNPDGSYGPLNLNGKTLDLIAKSSPDDPDASALYTYTSGAQITVLDDGSGVGATHSKVAIQWAAANLNAAMTQHYKLRVKTGTNPETIAYGQIVVQPT